MAFSLNFGFQTTTFWSEAHTYPIGSSTTFGATRATLLFKFNHYRECLSQDHPPNAVISFFTWVASSFTNVFLADTVLAFVALQAVLHLIRAMV